MQTLLRQRKIKNLTPQCEKCQLIRSFRLSRGTTETFEVVPLLSRRTRASRYQLEEIMELQFSRVLAFNKIDSNQLTSLSSSLQYTLFDIRIYIYSYITLFPTPQFLSNLIALSLTQFLISNYFSLHLYSKCRNLRQFLY